jgi:hypothetical protein
VLTLPGLVSKLYPPTSASFVAGTTDMNHYTQFVG